jgi:hypothetical protein
MRDPFPGRDHGREFMSKSALRRAFAKLAVAIDRRRRWEQFPTPVSLALLMGLQGSLRELNLYETNEAAFQPQLDPQPAPSGSPPAPSTAPTMTCLPRRWGPAGTRFGRNVPLRRTRRERGERLMTPNPCVVSTALLARGPQIPLTDLVLRMAHEPAPGRGAILS